MPPAGEDHRGRPRRPGKGEPFATAPPPLPPPSGLAARKPWCCSCQVREATHPPCDQTRECVGYAVLGAPGGYGHRLGLSVGPVVDLCYAYPTPAAPCQLTWHGTAGVLSGVSRQLT